MINKPRKPWISGIFTVIAIGLGHIYTGEAKRGIILFFIGQALLVISKPLLLLPVVPINLIATILLILTFVVFCVVDAVRLSRKFKFSYDLKKYNKWYVYLLFALITTFVIQPINKFAITQNIVQAYKIPSGAMKPTLLIGDHFLVNKFIYGIKIPYWRKTIIPIRNPKRGDIVVFIYPVNPNKDFIKRVIGISGDVIEIRDKKLYLNHKRVNQDYGVYTDSRILSAKVRPRDNFGPITVPEQSLFVMGDNRDESFDSRFWGFVDRSLVKGKVTNIYWSWNKEEFNVRWDRIGIEIK